MFGATHLEEFQHLGQGIFVRNLSFSCAVIKSIVSISKTQKATISDNNMAYRNELNLLASLSKLKAAQTQVATSLAAIGDSIQDGNIMKKKGHEEMDQFYGQLILDLIESDEIDNKLLGSAFFVLGKCTTPKIKEGFATYVKQNIDLIDDYHAIGNAITALENHCSL